VRCPECRTKLDTRDLIWPIPDVHEKVLPSEPMPEGECPDCGALVYKKNEFPNDPLRRREED
jgi:endogenous inhibitor of DNA gyrase (YacG/DUF329 family)